MGLVPAIRLIRSRRSILMRLNPYCSRFLENLCRYQNKANAFSIALSFSLSAFLALTPIAGAQSIHFSDRDTQYLSEGDGAEGFMVTEETATVYHKIPEVENQLYGHGYPDQAISQRISRIERTLFGNSQRGAAEKRMQFIETRMNEKNSQTTLMEQEPILIYLEEKLFQRTYLDKPMTERIQQLETQVFGHTFDHYPLAIRFRKLTYAMPIMAKEIRLTQGDRVIASTARTSHQPLRDVRSSKVDMSQLDASSSGNSRVLPNGEPLSEGHYVQSIYRNPDGNSLRWEPLPIKIYFKPDELENSFNQQAIQVWQDVFSVETVSSSNQADIIVTWDKATWDQNTSGLLTRPVVQVDDHRNIRTVVLISMFPLHSALPNYKCHALIHQLGHAFGLWGHSDDPNDVMYPAFSQEVNDFPSKWRARSAGVIPKPLASGSQDVLRNKNQLSQRDLNTLLKIYGLPATHLGTFNLY